MRENLPTKVDVAWVKAGGPVAKGHPPAGKFNAAQKALFWFTVGGGALVAVSGYLLMFPFTVTDIAGQQWAHMVHGLMAMVMIAAILGHIYIGTLGMEGAFEGMSTGRVDYNWAKEHHSALAGGGGDQGARGGGAPGRPRRGSRLTTAPPPLAAAHARDRPRRLERGRQDHPADPADPLPPSAGDRRFHRQARAPRDSTWTGPARIPGCTARPARDRCWSPPPAAGR